MLYAGAAGFAGGQDAFTLPLNLGANEYAAAENVLNRGGIVQTRPDSRSLLCCPCDRVAQGCVLFTPSNGIPYLVFASYGKIYVSPKPFTAYTQLPNIQFSYQSEKIAWAICQQWTDYDNAGNIIELPQPISVLIMQDGNTRAAMWDGTTNRHLNPTYSGTPGATLPGYDETKIGLWMVWSNNRLWVSRGNQVFASDLGNPLKFTETQYLNEVRSFYLPHDCTGMTETPDRQGIICFTQYEGVFIKSSVQDRTQWLSQADGVMQNTILPNIGCQSHRSIVTQYGLLWWFSAYGLINMNAASRLNLSSKLEVMDNEMFDSKFYMGSNMQDICGVAHDNLLLMSVPSGDKLNRHTWVLDQNPVDTSKSNLYSFEYTNAWASHWTGWRPVEWTKGIVDGRERVFFQSMDYDGQVRIWEAFSGSTGCDNAVPITAWMRSKEHHFDTLDRKRFRYAEFALGEFLGNASLMVCYAGRRGAYTSIFKGDLCASPGQVYYGSTYGSGTTYPLLAGNRPQTRIFRTEDSKAPSTCNTCGVESVEPNNVDTQFSLLFVWVGKLGVEWYRLAAMEDPKPEGGDKGCITETCPLSLNEAGCSGKNAFVATVPFTEFSATQTYTATEPPYSYTDTEDADSIVSQAAADQIALAKAVTMVLWEGGWTP